MLEVRMHGRAGQGVVTAASMLAEAAVRSGRFALKMPVYAGARRGEAVVAFVRIADEPIMDRSFVRFPNVVAVFDSRMAGPGFLAGMEAEGILVVNVPGAGAAPPSAAAPEAPKKGPAEARSARPYGCRTVCEIDADAIASEVFGARPIPLTNMPVLGALLRATGTPGLDGVVATVPSHFPCDVEPNLRALRAGFETCVVTVTEDSAVGPALVAPAPPRNAGLFRLSELPQGPVTDLTLRVALPTGLWRSARPVVGDNCTGCGVCVPLCPEGVVEVTSADDTGDAVAGRARARILYDYCKGCGICVNVCRAGALSMAPEGAGEGVREREVRSDGREG